MKTRNNQRRRFQVPYLGATVEKLWRENKKDESLRDCFKKVWKGERKHRC